MRKTEPWLVGIFAVAALWASAASADGGKNMKDFAVRPPSGPTDSRLAGNQAPKPQPAPQTPGSPSRMDAAPGVNPPAAPQAVEEATPTPEAKSPVETPPVVETQSAAAPSAPLWDNRAFWVVLALLLLLLAGGIEYFGRKRDERLAAEEPDDAVKA